MTHDSVRGCVRLLVRPSVRLSVGPSVHLSINRNKCAKLSQREAKGVPKCQCEQRLDESTYFVYTNLLLEWQNLIVAEPVHIWYLWIFYHKRRKSMELPTLGSTQQQHSKPVQKSLWQVYGTPITCPNHQPSILSLSYLIPILLPCYGTSRSPWAHQFNFNL